MWPTCSEFSTARAAGIRLTLALTSVFLLFARREGVRACSPTEGGEVSLVEKVHHSGVVWHGRVLKTFPDKAFDYGGGSQAYTAEMQVHCIIKGGKIGRIANVTQAGVIPGLCHTSNLEVGKDYIVLLYESEGVYQITDTEVLPTTENLNKVFSACGIEPQYPNGVSEHMADVRCHAKVTPCVSDEHMSDVIVNDTVPAIGEPYQPQLPPGHNENDGHEHDDHYDGDGNDHDEHHPGDGHDHSTDMPGHHEGDGHDHDGATTLGSDKTAHAHGEPGGDEHDKAKHDHIDSNAIFSDHDDPNHVHGDGNHDNVPQPDKKEGEPSNKVVGDEKQSGKSGGVAFCYSVLTMTLPLLVALAR